MKVLIEILLFFFTMDVALTKPDGAICFANHELNYFCDAKNYEDSKRACEDNNSTFVKINNADMTKAVNTLVDRVECPYKEDIFIGATASSERLWKWLDGSKVYLPTEDGYQDWQAGQPNDIGGIEDCLIIDKWSKRWKDSPCSPERKHYICQKKTVIDIKVNIISNGKECVAFVGSCLAQVEWYRNGAVVSSNSGQFTYQTTSPGSSILHHENATIGDAGEYVCAAWIVGNKTHKEFVSINIFVNETPEITDVRSFTCNTSLQVTWKPHTPSLGFPHRIMATTSLNGNLVKVIEAKPHERELHFTEILELESSTEYNIKVFACKDINNCKDEYASTRTAATTFGKVVTVTNATMQQNVNASYKDTCFVSWVWDYNITDTFQVTTYYNLSQTSNVTTSEQTLYTKNTSYFFLPIPGRVYYVEIQPVTNEKYCSKPVKAVGWCVGKELCQIIDQSDAVVIAPTTILSVLLLVVSSIAFTLYTRLKAIRSNPQSTATETQDTHDYVTMKSPEINDAEYLDLADNSSSSNLNVNTSRSIGQVPYENIEKAKPIYETVTTSHTSEYEM